MQNTFSRPNAKRIAQHGHASFMCLILSYNPYAPQRPGIGGLFFDIDLWPGDGWIEAKQQTVFVRQKKKQWLYMGTYEMVHEVPILAAKWRELHQSVCSSLVCAPQRLG